MDARSECGGALCPIHEAEERLRAIADASSKQAEYVSRLRDAYAEWGGLVNDQQNLWVDVDNDDDDLETCPATPVPTTCALAVGCVAAISLRLSSAISCTESTSRSSQSISTARMRKRLLASQPRVGAADNSVCGTAPSLSTPADDCSTYNRARSAHLADSPSPRASLVTADSDRWPKYSDRS